MKIITFKEDDSPELLADFDTFQKTKLKGCYENVSVMLDNKGHLAIKVDYEDKVFLFGLTGKTLDCILGAIDDLNIKVADQI